MAFLTQGPEGEQVPYGASKTNWKYVLIVIVLAVIFGGGILIYQYWWAAEQKSKTIEIPERDLEERVEVFEEIKIQKAVNAVIDLPEVKEWISLLKIEGADPRVEFDHKEENVYVIHAFEMIALQDTTHTATKGWYYVDFTTGEVRNFFGEVIFNDPELIEAETVNWQTYFNKKWRFKIEYPEYLRIINERSDGHALLLEFKHDTDEDISLHFLINGEIGFPCAARTNISYSIEGITSEGFALTDKRKDSLSVEEFEKICGPSLQQEKEMVLIVADTSVPLEELRTPLSGFNDPAHVSLYLFYRESMDLEPLFLEIVSSLQFISDIKSVDAPGDWKVYKSEEYGFELKYPSAYDNNPLCEPRIIEGETSALGFGPVVLKIKTAEGINLDKYVNNHIENNEFEEPPYYNKVDYREKILIADNLAEKVSWDFMGAHPSFPQDIFLKRANNIYHFQYDKRSYPESCLLHEGQSLEELALLMLSTFRFLE